MAEQDGAGVDPRLTELLADAQHTRRRYELYKAKVYARKPSSPVRLRELKRECEFAERRLSSAQGALRADAKEDGHEQEMVDARARIEAELKRDPDRPDTRIARASGTTFILVRAIRERLGLYSGSGPPA
ncbi:MAG: hypothetical protein ACRDL6_00650 [Solirubrobacterales bacterium]